MSTSAANPSLSREAYQVVRQRILRGELQLGQMISRRKLALELGMSFLPVSEALLRLEVEGLLESRPRAASAHPIRHATACGRMAVNAPSSRHPR